MMKSKANILIYLAHPAQFLFYKNAIILLRSKGHKVFVLIKTKDILSKLLDEAGLEYHNILPKPRSKSRINIFLSLLKRDWKIIKFIYRNNIHLLLGSDASLAHAGKLIGIPCITTLEDDYDVIKSLSLLTFPFTTTILAPTVCKVGRWEKKKINYNGYMKLAYLHPNVFSPSEEKLIIGITTPFFLIRLSGLDAHHDFGKKGISTELLEKIINTLEQKGNVYISSEKPLPHKLDKYRLMIPFSDIHHYLFYAGMLVCDSQSMAVEAAILGTPSIRISSFAGKISVLEELEHKYKLTFGFNPLNEELIMNKVLELLAQQNLKIVFNERREKMLSEKIDVSAFLNWFIEYYPVSLDIMKQNPDYQYNFK